MVGGKDRIAERRYDARRETIPPVRSHAAVLMQSTLWLSANYVHVEGYGHPDQPGSCALAAGARPRLYDPYLRGRPLREPDVAEELADTPHALASLKPFLGQLRSVVVQDPHVHHAFEARTVTGDVRRVGDDVPRCGMVDLHERTAGAGFYAEHLKTSLVAFNVLLHQLAGRRMGP